jgi:hypothetical protein
MGVKLLLTFLIFISYKILIKIIFLNKILEFKNKFIFLHGDWGLGIGDGDWGLGIGPNPQSPIPNPHPQSPINQKFLLIKINIKLIKFILIFKLYIYFIFNCK